jgi:hypothetical protein
MHKVLGDLDVVGSVGGGWSGIRHPRCVVKHSTTEEIANLSQFTLSFNSEIIDTDNWHDTSTNNSRITVDRTGLYIIEASIKFAANATGARGAQFRINATTVLSPAVQNDSISASDPHVVQIATFTPLTSGDFVEVRARQISGDALDTVADGVWFAAMFIGGDNS